VPVVRLGPVRPELDALSRILERRRPLLEPAPHAPPPSAHRKHVPAVCELACAGRLSRGQTQRSMPSGWSRARPGSLRPPAGPPRSPWCKAPQPGRHSHRSNFRNQRRGGADAAASAPLLRAAGHWATQTGGGRIWPRAPDGHRSWAYWGITSLNLSLRNASVPFALKSAAACGEMPPRLASSPVQPSRPRQRPGGADPARLPKIAPHNSSTWQYGSKGGYEHRTRGISQGSGETGGCGAGRGHYGGHPGRPS